LATEYSEFSEENQTGMDLFCNTNQVTLKNEFLKVISLCSL